MVNSIERHLQFLGKPPAKRLTVTYWWPQSTHNMSRATRRFDTLDEARVFLRKILAKGGAGQIN